MDAIEEVWQRIEAAWQTSAPPDSRPIAPGATEDEIKRLESLLAIVLPQDVRASYRLHNGGFTMKLVTEMRILPLKQMAERWRILDELLDDEGWARQPPYYFTDEVIRSGWQVGPVEPVWWNRRWIPIGQDNAGNLSCLDMTPTAGGTVGQIIDWDHECGPSRVLFPGFQQLLEAFAAQLPRASSELAN